VACSLKPRLQEASPVAAPARSGDRAEGPLRVSTRLARRNRLGVVKMRVPPLQDAELTPRGSGGAPPTRRKGPNTPLRKARASAPAVTHRQSGTCPAGAQEVVVHVGGHDGEGPVTGARKTDCAAAGIEDPPPLDGLE
jgi:hypothetical protein